MVNFILELQAGEISGEGLQAGVAVILTFGVGGPKKRTDPITITGKTTTIGIRTKLDFPDKTKTLYIELHKIIGDNKTRVIGKGTINVAGAILPLMSNGREASEIVHMKGSLKGGFPAKQELSLKLKLREASPEESADTDEALNRKRIVMAMKRQEERSNLRSKVELEARKYELKKRSGERPFAIDCVRCYNLPESLSKDQEHGTLLRVVSGQHGMLSRFITGTRHPGVSQAVEIQGAGDVMFTLEDRGYPYVKYAEAPLPVKELKVGSSYVAELVLDDEGTRILTVLSSKVNTQDQLDRFIEDETLQYLQIDITPFLNYPLVIRTRLCNPEDDVVADWNDSDDFDGEMEALSIRISKEGQDEEAFAAIKELDDELDEDGVVQQLTALTAVDAAERNAPPPRTLSFTARQMNQKYLLCEVYTPEVPERDEDTGIEGEADTPELAYLAACMIPLEELAQTKETLNKQTGIRYRTFTKQVEFRVNEDISEVLPSGIQFPRDLPVTLRLWDGGIIANNMGKMVKNDDEKRMGFDSWLANLKLVTVEELIFKDNFQAIKMDAYELQVQQTDHVLPDIDKKTFQTVDKKEELAYPRSVPGTPVMPRVREKRQRPKTQDVPRRLGRPMVPTRPVTPVTYTKEEVDAMIARAVAEANARMQNRMEKERLEMMDRLDVLNAAIRALTEEKARFQAELDERSEAIRKCGIEIMELRKRVKQLTADKSGLQQALAEKEALQQEMLQVDDNLEMLDRGDLEQRLKLLAASYKEERARSQDLLGKMQSMHGELTRMEELTRAHQSLQEAHTAQGEKMQQLQEKNNKLGKYVTTVQQQEQVIEKLEEMMEKALAEARETKSLKTQRDQMQKELNKLREEINNLQSQLGADVTEAVKKYQDENRELKEKIGELEAQIEELQKQAADSAAQDKLKEQIKKLQAEKEDLEKQLAEAKKKKGPQGPGMNEKERLQLLMRAEKAESRIRAVEQQLVTNSKRFAKEISGLKLKLLEAGVKP